MKKRFLFLVLIFIHVIVYSNECATATPVLCGSTVTGSTVGGTSSGLGACGTPSETSGADWFTFVGDGNYWEIETIPPGAGGQYDTKIWIFSGVCGSLVCVTGNDDGGSGSLSAVAFLTTLGTTYYVIVGGYAALEGNYEMTFTCSDCSAIGSNLIANAGAECPPLYGWTQVSGGWVRGIEVPAQVGTYHFFAGVGAGILELYQDIDVSAYSTTIDAGTEVFTFSGWIRDYNSSDQGQILVEYRNVTNVVLSTYDTGLQASTTWTQYIDSRNAPVNTRTIRIRLISLRNSGTDSDGYMDNLSLTASTALPIELLDFDAELIDNDYVNLTWETATEINNDYFVLERSADAVNFTPILQTSGAGNSSVKLSYQELDKEPYLAGVSYYRLKQVDYNGDYSYSQIETVFINDLDLINLYPNPTEGVLTLNIGSSSDAIINLTVVNALGQYVIQQQFNIEKGSNIKAINTQNLVPGVYQVTVTTPKGFFSFKKFNRK